MTTTMVCDLPDLIVDKGSSFGDLGDDSDYEICAKGLEFLNFPEEILDIFITAPGVYDTDGTEVPAAYVWERISKLNLSPTQS